MNYILFLFAKVIIIGEINKKNLKILVYYIFFYNFAPR